MEEKDWFGFQEEVLFKYPAPVATALGGWADVTLLTFKDGSKDLHLQTGDYHVGCLEIAKEMLEWRGLKIGKARLLGPSGLYYELEEVASGVEIPVHSE